MDYSKYSNILASAFNTNSSIFSLFDSEIFEKIPHGKLYRFRPCNAREFSSLENNFIWGSSASNFHDFWDSCIYVTNDELLKKQELVSCKLSVHIGIEAIKNTYSNYGLPDTFFEEYKKEILRLDSIFDTDEFWNEVENTYYQPRFQKLLNLIPDSSTDYTKYSQIVMDEIIYLSDTLKDMFKNLNAMTCLTEDYTNHILWEFYADNYSGFCIEYDFNKVYSDIISNSYDKLLLCLPVTYTNYIPTFNVELFIDEYIKGRLSFLDNSISPELINLFFKHSFRKNIDYSIEKEWRIIWKGKSNSLFHFPYISTIILGKDISLENEQRLLHIATSLNIDVYKQSVTKDTFDYDYVKISL